MENGEPAFPAGKSEIELAADVVFELTGKQLVTEPQEPFGCSREYWMEWTSDQEHVHPSRQSALALLSAGNSPSASCSYTGNRQSMP